MISGRLVLVSLATHALAAQYSIDRSCAQVLLMDQTTIDVTSRIRDGMREAVDIAKTAIEVMIGNSDDPDVQNFINLFWGQDPIKLGQARATFAALSLYEVDPSQHNPDDDEWRRYRRNTDVEIYCDGARLIDAPTGNNKMWDTAMDNTPLWSFEWGPLLDKYKKEYDLGDPLNLPGMMQTRNSDQFLHGAWHRAKNAPGAGRVRKKDPRWSTDRPHLACAIDIATYFLDEQNQMGWPTLTKERVEEIMDPRFYDEYLSKDPNNPPTRLPVDPFRMSMGFTLLHELTHTVQGGYLEDYPQGACYGWACVIASHDPENSDTIAYFGLGLKLWKMGYIVDGQGHVRAKV